MGQSSIKKNYVLNLINTLTGLVFPLITFPYASRILFADGIGQVQFFQSIIDYIALCSALGIPLYAVREIARYRDNIPVRNKITVEILLLHTLLTLAAYIVIAILAVICKKNRDQHSLISSFKCNIIIQHHRSNLVLPGSGGFQVYYDPVVIYEDLLVNSPVRFCQDSK